MINRIGTSRVPRLYIREWMKERGVNNRVLADRMDRAESTVSKLLAAADPDDGKNRRKKLKITVEYLSEFANALNVEAEQLFRDPKAPTRDELLRGYSHEELTSAIQLIEHTRSIAARNPALPASDDEEAERPKVTPARRAGAGRSK